MTVFALILEFLDCARRYLFTGFGNNFSPFGINQIMVVRDRVPAWIKLVTQPFAGHLVVETEILVSYHSASA